MARQPRHLESQKEEASPVVKEISRSLAQVLEVSVHLPTPPESAVLVMHASAGRRPPVVVGRTDRSAPQRLTLNAKDVPVWSPGATKPNLMDVAAFFRAETPRQASLLAELLPHVLETIESAQKEVDQAQFHEQVKALEVLVPKVEPTFDPRLGRAGEALRLQNGFMERERVFAAAGVTKHAGVSRRHPSRTTSRWRKAGKIFSVSYRGKDYFPSFQFADDGQPLPLIGPLLAALRTAGGMTDWDIALWFTTPNGWLSGQAPKTLLLDPNRESAARLKHAAEQEIASDDA
jgi:hypothetical protein